MRDCLHNSDRKAEVGGNRITMGYSVEYPLIQSHMFKKVLKDRLTTLVTGHYRLVWSENADCYKYRDADLGDIYLEPYEYEFLKLGTPVQVPGEQIDAVMFFGDGKIEFHLAESKERVNWGEFDEDTICLVIKSLEDM